MGEHRNYQPLDVVGNYVVAPVDERQRLGGMVKGQAPSRAYTQVEDLCVSGRPDYVDQVVDQRFLDGYFAYLSLQRQHVLAVHDGGNMVDGRIQRLAP